MGCLRCTDGSRLAVIPVAERDRGGVPYEVTLELYRDGRHFGAVGQRCGYLLAVLAERLAAARADDSPEAARWPDPDDRFPVCAPAVPPPGRGGQARTAGCRCGERCRAYPQSPWEQPSPDPELFAFRYRDRVDVTSTGELRCTVRTSWVWLPVSQLGPDAWSPAPTTGQGRWRAARRAIVEAWGAAGHGVRAVLTSSELATFLDALLAEAERQAGPGPRPLPAHTGQDMTNGPHARRSGP